MLILRMIFNYTDPNPFGKVGRFGFKVCKLTERWVYPAARFFAMYRIDTRLAPLLTMFIGFVLTYFFTQIVGNTFFVIDGLTAGVVTGNPKVIIGFVLYGLLSILVLFIFIRFISLVVCLYAKDVSRLCYESDQPDLSASSAADSADRDV